MRIPDAAMLQQSEEKIKLLNERLLAADDLVKQHVKVAEEAVSGWEKSKAESVALKHQLDALVEQKHAAEDRVTHLDGSLKECMRQLRHVREEQEEEIHDAIVKKTRDWDKLRSEFEARLADVDQQFMEAGQENRILYKTVQDQAETITGLGQARSQAEAKVEVLQVRIETFEKENASLKYEVCILNKELEIRNQEREINKRSADVASKQHLENVKKISKLESECQRLRIFVRRKLPGPGALVQMKLEVEALDKGENNRWRSGGKVGGSPKASYSEPLQKQDSEFLSERLLTMEEETKMLKEALAKRNSELQAVRLMHARTAGKLSTVEDNFDTFSHFSNLAKSPMLGHGNYSEGSTMLSISKEPSQASMSEDGNDDDRSCADSWASALITELSHFQKEKGTHKFNKVFEQPNSDMLGDFIEIERMVSMTPRRHLRASAELGILAESTTAPKMESTFSLENSLSDEVLAKKEEELQTTKKLCQEVSNKLASAEEQLSLLRTKNAANELSLFSLQQKLNMIFEARDGNEDADKILENIKNAIADAHCTSVDGLQVHVMKLSIVSSSAHVSNVGSPEGPHMSSSSECSPQAHASRSRSDAGTKTFTIGPELTSAVCKVVRLVEGIASSTNLHHSSEETQNNPPSDGDCESQCSGRPSMQNRPMELETKTRKFIAASNQFLHGKIDLVQFITELSSALNQIMEVDFSVAFSSSKNRKLQSSSSRPLPQPGTREDFSEADSNASDTSKSEGSEKVMAKVSPGDERMSDSKEFCALETEEELRKVRAEKAALESHMRAEFSRMAGVEETLVQLKQEKTELENYLEEEKEKVEIIKGQLHDVEQLVVNLRVRLAASESSKNLADEHLSNVTAEKENLESQLKDSETELYQMHETLEALEKSVTEEHFRNQELQAKCESLQQQLQKASLKCPRCAATLDGTKNSKDQGIADATEKLAECQRTILVLGKHLKELASPREPMPMLVDSSTAQSDVIERMQSGGEWRHQNQGSPSKREGKERNPTKISTDQEAVLPDVKSINNKGQRSKPSTSSDPGDTALSDALDEELVGIAKGGHGSGRTISDLFGDKSLVHEDYVRVVAQMPSSPDTQTDSKLVRYIPKPVSKKKIPHLFSGIDMSKSLNQAPLSSPQKHGNSFSRFFLRSKNR